MLKRSSVVIGMFLFLWRAVCSADVDTMVKWGGEYRFRAYIAENLSFGSSEKQDVYNHRLILTGEMIPNDDIQTQFAINVNQIIGGGNKRGFLGLENPDQSMNDIQILTAFADWHLGGSFFLKLGRLDLNWGNEVIVSSNRDDQRPYVFDGVLFGYDSENFVFNVGALRVGDWDRSLSSNSRIDPDESVYFMLLDLKSFGRTLETAEFFLLRFQSEDFNDTVNTIKGSSLNRIGFSLAGLQGRFFYQTDYVNLLGSYSDGVGARAWMGHLNLGANFEGKSQRGSIYLIGHYDSGNNASDIEVDQGYRPIYYNHHKYAGLMDILAWGNLTYYGLGATLIRKGQTEFRAQALRFSLTDKSTGPNSISYLGYGDRSSFISEDVSKNISATEALNLGTEIDFSVKRKFLSGAYLEFILGTFLPDKYFKAYGRDEKIYSFRFSTGFSF